MVVGVGVDPDVAWLTGSGLDAARGVPVDLHGRTALEDVFAAGDAAATFDGAPAGTCPDPIGRRPDARELEPRA